MDPKVMTSAMLVEHNIKRDKALILILSKALQLVDEDSLSVPIEQAISAAKEDLEWNESGEALEAMGTDPDNDEPYDTYAPQVYTLDNLDLSSFEDTPEKVTGYRDAVQRRKAAWENFISPRKESTQNIANSVQGVM